MAEFPYSVPMQIEPGAYLALQEEILELQRQEQASRDANEKERLRIERTRLEQVAREIELRLASSPIDYVAYELYKREVQAAGGKLYTGPPASDEDIQAMIASLHGEAAPKMGGVEGAATELTRLQHQQRMQARAPHKDPYLQEKMARAQLTMESQSDLAGILGVGEFGVGVPRTEAISRAESLKLSPAEMDILGSFLRAGFTPAGGGSQVSYDPVDYWREVEEGFIPTIQTPAMAKYAF